MYLANLVLHNVGLGPSDHNKRLVLSTVGYNSASSGETQRIWHCFILYSFWKKLLTLVKYGFITYMLTTIMVFMETGFWVLFTKFLITFNICCVNLRINLWESKMENYQRVNGERENELWLNLECNGFFSESMDLPTGPKILIKFLRNNESTPGERSTLKTTSFITEGLRIKFKEFLLQVLTGNFWISRTVPWESVKHGRE